MKTKFRAAKIQDLLRDLVSAFVEMPGEIVIAHQTSIDGDCYFAMKGALEDEPILIGTRGSHVNALKLLVEKMGDAEERNFNLRLITEGKPQGLRKREKLDVVSHDPSEDIKLLCRVLSAVGLDLKSGFAVSVGSGYGPRKSLTFVFEIKVQTDEQYLQLTVPSESYINRMTMEEATIIGAIGSLFRAIAMKSGVRYNLVVQKHLS